MRDVNVTRSNVNAVAALRSWILEIVETTRKPGSPPNVEEIFDTVCGFLSEQIPIESDDEELALLSYVEAVIGQPMMRTGTSKRIVPADCLRSRERTPDEILSLLKLEPNATCGFSNIREQAITRGRCLAVRSPRRIP